MVISASTQLTKRICVAPPAQGALLRQTNTSTRAEVDVLDVVGVGVGVDHATAEALARMYEQNERSLFLQYSMYRLCEAYMNGMLTRGSSSEILAVEMARYKAAATAAGAKLAECNKKKGKLEAIQSALIGTEPATRVQRDDLDEQISSLECEQYASDQQSASDTAALLEKRLANMDKSPSDDQGILYWIAFQNILETSVELARLDAQAARLRAQTQAALAKEAQLEAENKVKRLEASAKTLDAVREKALDNAIDRAKCADDCADKKGDNEK
ncbi:hypothetical protein DB30_02038 [Enhygromyxa salina]|uniref:Uncharacterized protein n=1 Tax=Enhygromyxa salina TaxID=215803 RepID=A0A0C1ZMB4_9BACT|nr:hypothetical protein DB30_02038 [Enhygromyxa salina]